MAKYIEKHANGPENLANISRKCVAITLNLNIFPSRGEKASAIYQHLRESERQRTKSKSKIREF